MPYPLGKTTIPWLITLNVGIAWSVGSFATYILSLHFRGIGVPSSLQVLFESSLVDDQDDLAGLLCYTATFAVFLVLSLHQVSQYRHTLHLPLPKGRTVAVAFLKSSVVLAPIWGAVGWFFENHQYGLPGDGNWPAIAGLTAIASFHSFLFHSFLFHSLMPRLPHGETCAGKLPYPKSS